MKRSFSAMRVGNDMVRAKTTIRGEEVGDTPTDQEKRVLQDLFLKSLASQMSLTACQGNPFENMAVFFDGRAWVAECTAIVPEIKRS